MDIKKIEEMRRLHQEGESYRAIGKKFSIHQQTVRYYLKRYLDYNPISPKPIDFDSVWALYEAGFTMTQIAAHFRVSVSTISRKIRGS
jgi:transposase